MSLDQSDEGREGCKRLEQIASSLKAGERVEPVTVHDLVRWFGAEYRGSQVNDLIRDALFQNNLRVEPGLNERGIDGLIGFHEGAVIDDIDREQFANYRTLYEGLSINEIEAAFLDKLWLERLSDVVAGWIDRNPGATKSEIQAKALALNELDFDTIVKEEEAAYITPFPSTTIRNKPQFARLNAISREGSGRLNRLYTAIGRFIFEYSQLDLIIRRAVGEVLKLDKERFHVITSSYDFAELCRVTPSLYSTVSGCTEEMQRELEKLFKDCQKINEMRVRIVHGTWFLSGEELGTEHVSRTSLKPKIYFPRIEDIENLCNDVADLQSRLDKFLIGLIRQA